MRLCLQAGSFLSPNQQRQHLRVKLYSDSIDICFHWAAWPCVLTITSDHSQLDSGQ